MESEGTRTKSDEPLNISRASRQYVFAQNGEEYLDCLNGSTHVGHCHPQVTAGTTSQLEKLATTQGFVSDVLNQFVNQLVLLLPEELNVVYMCNNGIEANDLAMLLAREYTKNKDLVTFEGAYHGYLLPLLDVSPKISTTTKDNVHIVPFPDMYRGPNFQKQTKDSPPSPNSLPETPMSKEMMADKYATLAETTIGKARKMGRNGISAFICEPFLVVPGLQVLPRSYFERVYSAVRENGGVFIADENQTGLGRIGTHYWGFQKIGIVPDIVTTGISIGNGHPMAAVICRREISECLRGYFSTFGGNPVSCSIGLAVLRVLKNEKLKSSANNVGRFLSSLLANIKVKYSEKVGDIRGQGLIWAIEIVKDISKEADPAFARDIVDIMRTKEKILIGLTGIEHNILLLTPPLCFTVDNSRRFVKSLDNSIANAVGTEKADPSTLKAPIQKLPLKRPLISEASTSGTMKDPEEKPAKRKTTEVGSKNEPANYDNPRENYDDLD